jgi:tripartite-type tricarboxylate transporter receptor subunit TctC
MASQNGFNGASSPFQRCLFFFRTDRIATILCWPPSGAAGIIGVNRVANAAPDGYTFLLGSIGTHAYNQTIYKKPRYDATADFTPVALFAEQPMVLTTRKNFPANNLPEFIDYLKKNSTKLQFGSAGPGTTTHLGCALLNSVMDCTDDQCIHGHAG